MELKYFNNICKVLVARKYINTSEATAKKRLSGGGGNEYSVTVEKPEELPAVRVLPLITRLEEDKWLQRDQRGRIELGLRTYLELSNYIQELIAQCEEEEEEVVYDDDEDDEEKEDEGGESSSKKRKKMSSSSSSSSSSIRMKSSDLPQLIMY